MQFRRNKGSLASRVTASASIQRQVVWASTRLATAMIAVKALSASKDLLAAQAYGAGHEMDAFFISAALPAFLTNVLGAVLAAAMLPVYVRIREQDGEVRAGNVLVSFIIAAGLAFVALAGMLALASSHLIAFTAWKVDPLVQTLASRLLYFSLGAFVLSSVSMLLASALNSVNRFGITSLSSLSVPVTAVTFLLFGENRFGIYALATGIVVGCLLELAFLLWASVRLGLVKRFALDVRSVFGLSRHMLPLMLSAAVLSSSGLIDQTVASTLGPGAVSALAYGNKLVSLVNAVIVTSVATALFPVFTQLVARGAWAELRGTVTRFFGLVAAATVVLTLILIAMNESLVRTLFQHGRFTFETTQVVSSVQLAFLVQIPFFALGTISSRVLLAMNHYKTVLVVTCCGLTINIVADLILSSYWGVVGIAASTSLVYMSTCGLMLAVIYRRLWTINIEKAMPAPHFTVRSRRSNGSTVAVD